MEKAWDEMENEVWKSVKGFEGTYEVSNLGRIRSLDRIIGNKLLIGKVLSTKTKDVKKYEKVALYYHSEVKYYKAHQVVARAFIELPDTENYYEVNHIDGNKHNNNVNNLEWVTRLENSHHKLKLGTMLLGEKHQNTKFSESLVRKIKLLIKEGYTNKEIYTSIDMENMPNDYISQIRRETVWKHIKV